jgi:rhodanese-related sulfurtransferase
MKKIEYLIFAALLLGSFITLFLPDTKAVAHIIGEEQLLKEVSLKSRYISTDEVAQTIIEGDASYLYIDVRSPEEFSKYTIDGAINIPANEVMKGDNINYFNQDVYTTVLFSNGTSLADQTWMRLRSYDYKGNKVLKGGLNEWYRTIINPQEPKDTELSSEAKDLYLFRKGASLYFTGAQVVGTAPKKKSKASKKPIVKRKKKAVSGGCG